MTISYWRQTVHYGVGQYSYIASCVFYAPALKQIIKLLILIITRVSYSSHEYLHCTFDFRIPFHRLTKRADTSFWCTTCREFTVLYCMKNIKSISFSRFSSHFCSYSKRKTGLLFYFYRDSTSTLIRITRETKILSNIYCRLMTMHFRDILLS